MDSCGGGERQDDGNPTSIVSLHAVSVPTSGASEEGRGNCRALRVVDSLRSRPLCSGAVESQPRRQHSQPHNYHLPNPLHLSELHPKRKQVARCLSKPCTRHPNDNCCAAVASVTLRHRPRHDRLIARSRKAHYSALSAPVRCSTPPSALVESGTPNSEPSRLDTRQGNQPLCIKYDPGP